MAVPLVMLGVFFAGSKQLRDSNLYQPSHRIQVCRAVRFLPPMAPPLPVSTHGACLLLFPDSFGVFFTVVVPVVNEMYGRKEFGVIMGGQLACQVGL